LHLSRAVDVNNTKNSGENDEQEIGRDDDGSSIGHSRVGVGGKPTSGDESRTAHRQEAELVEKKFCRPNE